MKNSVLLLVLFSALLGSFGQIFFKIASEKFSFDLKVMLTNLPFLIGILVYGISAFIFVWALKQGDLSILYPIIATSYIWVTLLSFIFFKEIITLNKVLGVFLIILGVFFVTN